MTRDMDLIREILTQIENRQYDRKPFDLEIAGRSREAIGYHVMLLNQAGLIRAQDLTCISDVDASRWKPISLTWEGHEFLEAAKDSENWSRAKSILTRKGGGIVFDVLKALLIEISKRAALATLTGSVL